MRHASKIALAFALSALGCAEQLQLLDRGPVGGVSPCSFWPPPPSSTTWLASPSPSPSLYLESLRAVAGELELTLREGGYPQQRWYPIGVGQSHGFAVTTRLERLEADGRPSSSARWSPLYSDAANLRWLTQARAPALPHAGHYRVLLLAYTDLPIGRTSKAPSWNEETVMDWPDAARDFSPRDVTAAAHVPRGYQLAIYEYRYGWDGVDDRGKLLLPPDRESASQTSPPLSTPLEQRGLAPHALE